MAVAAVVMAAAMAVMASVAVVTAASAVMATAVMATAVMEAEGLPPNIVEFFRCRMPMCHEQHTLAASPQVTITEVGRSPS